MTDAATALSEGTERLRTSSTAPRIDALTLLEATLRKPRAWLVAFGEHPVSAEDDARYRALCERRASGVPTAYLLGSVGFYGREFAVDERVLVPRPETEHVIDEVVAFLGQREAAVLDIGTGCGAIACSIAASTNARVYATDLSHGAVAVARENARRFNLEGRCVIERGDLLDPYAGRRFDVVVANLPYIPTADLPVAPDPVSFEPRSALDGGGDGLAVYRRLMPSLASALKPNALLLLEAAPPTIAELASLVRSTLQQFSVEIGRDYAGLDRYVKAFR